MDTFISTLNDFQNHLFGRHLSGALSKNKLRNILLFVEQMRRKKDCKQNR